MDWFMMVFKKYAQFDGRSRRSEYWYFNLFYILILMALCIPAVGLLGFGQHMHSTIITALGGIIYFAMAIFCLAVIVPSIAVMVRRLHDTGRSGWWYFISFVPLIGPIVLLVFLLTDSQPGDNMYGPNPKGIGAAPWGMAPLPPAQY